RRRRGGLVVTAVVLLNIERDKINEVAQQLVAIEAISEVYSVAGQYDLIAIVRAKDNDDLAAVVTGDLLKLPGVQRSETLIAFRVLSRHDLDRMFSIGLE
ncbi:MAG TPA: Lrp/AsnC ligand binding domain-containing protein, partial [Thermoanaerobaculia bacterium]|nr:Lrp/AsnC ligand binding domain-containing protein [Thermoanaerobaculia bacterium]